MSRGKAFFFRSYFLSPKKQINKKCRQALHEVLLKPQYKQAEVPQYSFPTPLFSVAPSVDISMIPRPQIRISKLVTKRSGRLPPFSFKINLNDTSLYMSINFFGLYPLLLVEFFLKPVCSTMVRKLSFQVPGKRIESRHFYSCSYSPIKTLPNFLSLPTRQGNHLFPQAAFFQKCVSPNSSKSWKL